MRVCVLTVSRRSQSLNSLLRGRLVVPCRLQSSQAVQNLITEVENDKSMTKTRLRSSLENIMNKLLTEEELNSQRTKKAGRSRFTSFIIGGALFVVLSAAVFQGVGRRGFDSEMFKDNFEEFMPNNSLSQPAAALTGKKPLVNTTTFKDVQGNTDAKEELADLVDYLKNPGKYRIMNLDLPKGVLLEGPPGTGKTLLARALAGEAGVPFLSTNGSSFEQVFAGVGAQRVRHLFARARSLSPCIVFIDEVDTLGSRRETPQNYHKQTLNQILGEMDGFAKSSGVIVIGATNLASSLDDALLRPGRFDRKIHVSLPDKKVRKDMLDHYLKDKRAPDVDTELLASATTGFSGADIAAMVNRAGIEAVKKGRKAITSALLIDAKETLLMGRSNTERMMSDDTKTTVSFHEAGHALVALFTPGANPIYKVTMLPRGGALGFVAQHRREEHLMSKQAFLAQMDVAMGGRAAEELTFGNSKVTQGAANDFEKATGLAKAMVTQYGMSNVGLVHFSDKQLKALDPKHMATVDAEVKRLVDDSYERAKGILKKHKKEHEKLAAALRVEETLTLDRVKEVIGLATAPSPQL